MWNTNSSSDPCATARMFINPRETCLDCIACTRYYEYQCDYTHVYVCMCKCVSVTFSLKLTIVISNYTINGTQDVIANKVCRKRKQKRKKKKSNRYAGVYILLFDNMDAGEIFKCKIRQYLFFLHVYVCARARCKFV